MTLPSPQPGLVIRYNYLWAHDATQGREEGTKERPAAVVLVIGKPSAASPRVYVVPITHSQPAKGVASIEIPAEVARTAKLDAGRSWVVLSEFNEFLWPGFDLARVPGRAPPTVAYGFLTPGFFAKVRDRWLELDAAAKSQGVPRDEKTAAIGIAQRAPNSAIRRLPQPKRGSWTTIRR